MTSKSQDDSAKTGTFEPWTFTTISDIDDDEETEVLDVTTPMLDETIRDSLSVPITPKERRTSKQTNITRLIWQQIVLNRGQNVTTFTLLYALSGCFAYSVGTYISTQMSSLQRQFGLASTETGFITSCNEVGFFLVILISTQFGKSFHIPRALMKMTLIFAIAVCGISLTYLFRPISHLGNSTLAYSGHMDDILCLQKPGQLYKTTTSEQECQLIFQENSKRRRIVFAIFIVCMLVQGMCKAPRATLLPTFIENNVAKKTHTGIYSVLLFSISMIGPAFIFSLGALISNTPVDLKDRTGSYLGGESGWIGAWWLGFIIIGTMSVFITLPLVCFPRAIRKRAPEPPRHCNTLEGDDGAFIAETMQSVKQKFPPFKKIIKDFCFSVISLLKKPIYTTILISDCILLFSLVGLWTFLPKYMEEQFRLPSGKINLILALISALSTAIGLTLGGIWSFQLKQEPRKLIKVKLFCLILCATLDILRLFLHCEQPHVQNNPYDTRSFNSTSVRSFINCGCDSNKFFPVCGANYENYFSPCHAGCTTWNHRQFSGCTEIPSGQSMVGLCRDNCIMFNFFILITFILHLMKSIDIIPSYILIMRSQPEKDKQLGIAIFSAVVSLLSFLPGPVVFGYLVDSTCYLWDWTCGVRGHCKLYQLKNLHGLLFGSMLVSRVGAICFSCVTFICILRKRLNIVYRPLNPEENCSEL